MNENKITSKNIQNRIREAINQPRVGSKIKSIGLYALMKEYGWLGGKYKPKQKDTAKMN